MQLQASIYATLDSSKKSTLPLNHLQRFRFQVLFQWPICLQSLLSSLKRWSMELGAKCNTVGRAVVTVTAVS